MLYSRHLTTDIRKRRALGVGRDSVRTLCIMETLAPLDLCSLVCYSALMKGEPVTSDYAIVREALESFGLVEADLSSLALALAPILQRAREEGWDDARFFPDTRKNPYRRKE